MMTRDESSEDGGFHGWVVTMTSPGPNGAPLVEIYDAAIRDAVQAVEAVQRAVGAKPGMTIKLGPKLSRKALHELGLRPGEILARTDGI
jgi:hypothetical protein